MKKATILTVTASGLRKKDGICMLLLDYYSYFDKEKYEIDVIVFGDCNIKVVEEFQTIGVNIRNLPSRRNEYVRYIKALTRLIKKRKYDAIYVHGSSAIMAVELLIAKLCGCKVRIAHSHNTTCNHKVIDRLMRPFFYCSYTQALACGTDAGRWLYPKRKFEVIKNGRDIDKYKFDRDKRLEVRKRLELDDDTIAVGHVGSINKQKNHIFLIGMLKELIIKEKNVKMYFMGEDGGTKEQIEQLVKDNDLGEYVVFTGAIDNVPDMLQAMDVMVLPSLYEGLPLVAVEWQIAALPCILSNNVTRECAYTELVHFMSLNAGYAAWVEKILLLGRRGYERDSMGRDVIQKTRENGFDIRKTAEKLQGYFVERK